MSRLPPGMQPAAIRSKTSLLIAGTRAAIISAPTWLARHIALKMAEQPKPGHIHRGPHQASLGQFRPGIVQLRHNRDHFAFQQRLGQPALDARGDDTRAERFRQDQHVARPSFRVGQHAPRRNQAGDGQAIDRFRVSNRVAADQSALRFFDLRARRREGFD